VRGERSAAAAAAAEETGERGERGERREARRAERVAQFHFFFSSRGEGEGGRARACARGCASVRRNVSLSFSLTIQVLRQARGASEAEVREGRHGGVTRGKPKESNNVPCTVSQ